MTTKTWIIETPEQLTSFLIVAAEWKVEKPIYIKASDERVRTIQQNKLLHAEIREVVNEKRLFAGQEWEVEDWKRIFSSGYQKSESQTDPKLICGMEGEIVNMTKGTHEMGVKELSGLVEYLRSWRYG